MLKTLRINFFVLCGLLIAVEITGQLVALIKNRNFLFSDHDIDERHRLFKPHPYLSVNMSSNVNTSFEKDKEFHSVKTTEIGTRWTGADLKDTSKIRIACIGGSTTFCTGVDDEDSWPAILQKKLGDNYAVVNYGVPAYKSVEAIIQLALYVTELKPDLVVLYQGGNDFYNYHLENTYPDYFQHGEVLMPKALLGTHKYESGFEKFMRKSGFFYIVHNIEELMYEVKMPHRHNVPDKVVDALYTRNIRSMLALTSSMGAPELFIGQVLNPFIEREEKPWSIRVQKDSILPFMDRVNEMAKQVCAADSNCTYLEFKNSLPWKPEHYWDEMHFTKEGNEVFAEGVRKAIEQKLTRPDLN